MRALLKNNQVLIKVLLALFIGAQALFIYHVFFSEWQGPGDFGGNINYIPAVMIGAGKGFRDVDHETLENTPALNDFIEFKTMRLAPSALPETLQTHEPNDLHKVYLYLLYTVGGLWRIFGISWNVVRALLVVTLFLYAILIYRISRLVMPPVWSLLVAHAFVWNGAVLGTMQRSFRDFSKGTFILAVVLILGAMVKTPPSRRRYLSGAVLMGIVLGIGMGFRRDMQAMLPLTILVLVSCRLQSMPTPWRSRLIATLLLVVLFIGCSFPILVSFYPHRWTNAHDAIMGFATSSDTDVGLLQPASYEKHNLPSDFYTTFRVWTYERYGASTKASAYLASIRDKESYSSSYYRYIVRTVLLFPADFIVRAYASVLRSCTGVQPTLLLPFQFFERFGVFFVGIALMMIAASNFYQAWQVLLILCLFCGYTSIQYSTRHAFHTTFVPYWFGGFVLYSAYCAFRNRHQLAHHWCMKRAGRRVFPVVLWALSVLLVFYVPLKTARHIQEQQIGQVVAAYRSAARIPVPHVVTHNYEEGTLFRPFDAVPREQPAALKKPSESVGMSVYTARFSGQSGPLHINLVYDWSATGFDLSGILQSHTYAEMETGELSVYFPVYEIEAGEDWNAFSGLWMPKEQAQYFSGFEKILDVEELGYFLHLTVPEDMDAFIASQSLYWPWPHIPRDHDGFRRGDVRLTNTVQEIDRHLKNDAIEQAVILIQSYLQRRPESIQFNVLLAQAYSQAGRSEEAWRVLDEMLELYPGHWQLYRRLNLLFMDTGGVEARYAGWRRIAAHRPDSEAALRYLEDATVAVAQWALSTSNLMRYQELMDHHPEFKQGALLGDAWLEKHGDTKRRQEFWQEIVANHPDATLPYLRLGMALEDGGAYNAAAEAYVTAYHNNTHHPEAAIRYAISVQPVPDAATMAGMLAETIGTHPEYTPLLLDCLEQAGDRALNREDYSAAEVYYRQTGPYLHGVEDPYRLMKLRFGPAEMLAAQKHIDDALLELRRLLIVFPQYDAGYTLADNLLIEHADPKDRVAFWREISQSLRDSVQPWVRLGHALINVRQLDEGTRAYKVACVNGPTDNEALIYYMTAPSSQIHDEARMRNLDHILEKHPSLTGFISSCFAGSAMSFETQHDHERAARFHLFSAQYDPEASRVQLEEAKVRWRVEYFLLDKAPIAPSLDVYITREHPQQAAAAQKRLMEAAKELIAQETLDSAQRAARMAVAIAPDKEDAWMLLAHIHERADNYAGALDVYRKGIGPAQHITQLVRAMYALYEKNELLSLYGIEEFERLKAAHPDSPIVALCHAQSLEAQERWHDAADAYRNARRRFPDFWEFTLRLGVVSGRLGDADTAVTLISQALSKDHSLREEAVMAIEDAVHALRKEGRLHVVERLYSLWVDLAPDDPDLLLHWADLLEAMDNQAATVEVLKQAISLEFSPSVREAAQRLDEILDVEERFAFWQRIMRQDSSLEVLDAAASERGEEKLFVHIHYAKALADRGEPEKAIRLLNNIYQQYPANHPVRLTLGVLQCQYGDCVPGMRHIRTTLQDHSQHPEDAFDRLEQTFEGLMETEQYIYAEQLARFLTSLNPENPLYVFLLGQALFSQEQYGAAIEHFTQVLLRAPESPRSARLLDAAFEHTDNPEARCLVWQTIVEAHPEAEVPRKHLCVVNSKS